MLKITAAQADEWVGGSWFSGYTDRVDLYEDPVTVDEFDAETRADGLGHPEYAVFGGGLVVHGTMNVEDNGWHSIYGVRGTLRARRLVLGDAVLAVSGLVEIDEWLFGPLNEGLFDVAGRRVESPGDVDVMLRHIRAPLIAVFDRLRDRFLLRERGEPRDNGDLLPELLDDDVRHGVNEKVLRERIYAAAPLFREPQGQGS